MIYTNTQRYTALFLILALLLMVALPQPAKAFAIADDVALALLVGALAAVGIISSAPKMADLTQGLQSLLGDWELDRGLASGTLIGQIASTAVALGSGAYQIGNAAWEKITDFVSFLQGEKGLDYDSPYEYGESTFLDVLPYSEFSPSTWRSSAQILNNQPMGGYYLGNGGSLSFSVNGVTYTVHDDGGPFTLNGRKYYYYGVYRDSDNSRIALNSSGPNASDIVYFSIVMRGTSRVLAFYSPQYSFSGSNVSLSPTQRAYVSGDFSPTFTIPLSDSIQPTISGITLTQDYPDSEAPPLPYFPDLPLNVRVPGVAAGDLEGIAAGISDAVDAGDLSAVGSEGADLGELSGYTPNLSSFFPFCIPFDIYNMIEALDAEPQAPHIEIPLDFSLDGGEETLVEQDSRNKIVVDFSEWEDTAKVLRAMELVLFAVGLALLTRKVIKW